MRYFLFQVKNGDENDIENIGGGTSRLESLYVIQHPKAEKHLTLKVTEPYLPVKLWRAYECFFFRRIDSLDQTSFSECVSDTSFLIGCVFSPINFFGCS